MWSLCNEALCGDWDPATASKLKQRIRELDPGLPHMPHSALRPVTAAVNVPDQVISFRKTLDLSGINYNQFRYDELRAQVGPPWQPMIGSETSSDFSDRSVYKNENLTKMYVSAYDVNFPSWGSTAEDAWCAIATRPYMSGGFYWTGFDYKGEPTPYGWPNVNSHFGVIDIVGFPKDNFYYHMAQFYQKDERLIAHIVPGHWNFVQEEKVPVWVYTNGDGVELFVDGKSLGRKEMPREGEGGKVSCRHVNWTVPFRGGGGKVVARVYYGQEDHEGPAGAVEPGYSVGSPPGMILGAAPVNTIIHGSSSIVGAVDDHVDGGGGQKIPSAPRGGRTTTAFFIETSIQTTGPPVALKLDLAYPTAPSILPSRTVLIDVSLLDAENRPTLWASTPAEFSLHSAVMVHDRRMDGKLAEEGTLSVGHGGLQAGRRGGLGARILGVGNGDPSSHESDLPDTPFEARRTVWNGKARLVIRAGLPGSFWVVAQAKGLQSAKLEVKVWNPEERKTTEELQPWRSEERAVHPELLSPQFAGTAVPGVLLKPVQDEIFA